MPHVATHGASLSMARAGGSNRSRHGALGRPVAPPDLSQSSDH